jgi:hypothetical protein
MTYHQKLGRSLGSSPPLVAALAMLLIMCGCGDSGTAWQTVTVIDPQATDSEVLLLSPPYGKEASPASVTLLWDGRQVFSGKLPRADEDGLTGMPITLVMIKTSPGQHALEASSDGKSYRLDIKIESQQKLYVRLFGVDKSGRKVLLENLGDDPKLF